MKTSDCRCCGKPVHHSVSFPIHTACITRHWGKHYKGKNASRCAEFKPNSPLWRLPERNGVLQ